MVEVPQFLRVNEVASILDMRPRQVHRLIFRGELRAIKVGGRGEWRIAADSLEEYVAAGYAATQQYIASNPSSESSTVEAEDEADEMTEAVPSERSDR
jgi:excisionase family DNA binding protein